MQYKLIFTVEILHDYYTDKFCADFEVVPSPETASVLNGQGLLWKSIGHKLLILARTDGANKPLVSMDVSKKLTFYLRQNNPHFNNFTNLDYHPAQAKRYYFSNINQTKIGSVLYLNSPIALYNNATVYAIGSFSANAGNDVFEAIKPSNSGDAHAQADTAFWVNRGKFQYVSSDDLLEFTPFIYQFTTTAATNFAINVFGFNVTSGVYDLPVLDTVNLTFATAQTTVPIRLETLPTAKYRIDVNGDSKFVYLDGDAVYKNIFGVIELFNHLPGANAFALFSATGLIKSPVFTLRFANRSIIWKYQSRTADVTAIEDSALNLAFTPEAGNQFVSTKPIPMQQKPLTTLLLKSTLLGDVLPLANPGTDRLATILKDGNTYLCSELHLNY